MGAAPRYCGRSEACKLNVPNRGIDHASGNIQQRQSVNRHSMNVMLLRSLHPLIFRVVAKAGYYSMQNLLLLSIVCDGPTSGWFVWHYHLLRYIRVVLNNKEVLPQIREPIYTIRKLLSICSFIRQKKCTELDGTN